MKDLRAEQISFQVVDKEAEDRSTLLYRVEPPVPLSRYGEVVTGIDDAFMGVDAEVANINPNALTSLRNGNRIAISAEGSSSIIRWTFTGLLDRVQAPVSNQLRSVMDGIVESTIANL